MEKQSQKLLPKWRKEITKNIVGVHFGNKMKKSKEGSVLAIVFHVKHKLEHPIKPIPKFVKVKMEDGKVKDIPTDVIQTGTTKLLSLHMGDKAKSRETSMDDYGTAGLFMKKGANYYMCSNMHVLAPQFISRGSVQIPEGSQRLNVRIYNSEDTAFAFLEKASFQSIDLAMAKIERPSLLTNKIRSIGNISGEANIGAIKRGERVSIYGATSGFMNGTIEKLNIAKYVEYDGKETLIRNLIAIKCDATFGDSGSPVVLRGINAVVGILVSMDDEYVYLITIDTIKTFTKAQLIIIH
ncbi:MAG: hypothetical protein WDO71_20505 [Bacteroidota bacterium]